MGYVNCSCYTGRCESCGGTGRTFATELTRMVLVKEPRRDCPVCHGTGQCQKCGGTKKVRKDDPPKEQESYVSGGGYSGGSDGSSIFGWALIIVAICIALGIVYAFLNMINNDPNRSAEQRLQAPQREADERRAREAEERRELEDLPAGLRITDRNFVEEGDSTLGPFLLFNTPPPSDASVYHVYTKSYQGSWKEEEITGVNIQEMSDGTYRVILDTRHMVSTGGGGRIVVSWDW